MIWKAGSYAQPVRPNRRAADAIALASPVVPQCKEVGRPEIAGPEGLQPTTPVEVVGSQCRHKLRLTGSPEAGRKRDGIDAE